MDNLNKYIAISNILCNYGIVKGWWDKSNNQVSTVNISSKKTYSLVFARFAVKNYELELNKSSKAELDSKIIEILYNDFPFLRNEDIQFCDTDKLTKENWKIDKVQKSILKYKITNIS